MNLNQKQQDFEEPCNVAAILYKYHKNPHHTQANFALYIAEPQLTQEELLNFKQQINADLLIAVMTENADLTTLEVADRVIYCQAKDVESLMQQLNSYADEAAFISVDFQDILMCFKQANRADFVTFETTLDKLIDDLPKYRQTMQEAIKSSPTINGMINFIQASKKFRFEQHDLIINHHDSLSLDNIPTFYAVTFGLKENRCIISNLFFSNDAKLPIAKPFSDLEIDRMFNEHMQWINDEKSIINEEELLQQMIDFVQTSENPTVSSIQHKFCLSYNRANYFMSRLKKQGLMTQ